MPRELITPLTQRETIYSDIRKDMDFNPISLKQELDKLLFDKNYLEAIEKGYTEIYEKMGEKGASERTAEEMIKCLKKH